MNQSLPKIQTMSERPKVTCDLDLLEEILTEIGGELMAWLNKHTYSTLNQPAEPPKYPELPEEIKDKVTVA